MSSLFEGKPPLTPVSLTQRPYSVNNNNQNNNKVFQPLESNSFKINKNRDFFTPSDIQNKTFYNGRKKSDIHPLDFYTLGKIPPNTVYPNLEWNKGIKSTSNDIIYRNALSINTKKYNKIDLHKRITNLYEQNITENNYMEPIKIYKTYEKYNLPKYATNILMYKLMREKYFARDIHSPIAQGKCLSLKDFVKQKEKILKKDNLNLDKVHSNKDIKPKEMKSEELKKTNKNEEIKDMAKTHHPTIKYKDPNDYTKQDLKSNTLYFDKNRNQMLKQKKWIFENMKK